MLTRFLGCLVVLLAFSFLAVDAGGTKKADPKDKKVEEKKVEEKKADNVPEFDEKSAYIGPIKSVNRKEKTFVVAVEKTKRDHTFQVTRNTNFYGPRGGDRNETGIEDDCMAAGYMIKVIATKDGRSAASVQFDVRKGEETKKDEPKKK